MCGYECNSCADTEGGQCPCVYVNPFTNDNWDPDKLVCPITGEEAEFEYKGE